MQILLRIARKLFAGPCQWDQVKQELQEKQTEMHASNAAHVHILCPVRIHIAGTHHQNRGIVECTKKESWGRLLRCSESAAEA